MAHREFRDERGRLWEVWDVMPERRDRRGGADRRTEARATFDRRKRRVLSAAVSGDLAKGWLVFSSALERRRYTPLPDRWAEVTDEQLNAWCASARPIPLPRRLIK
jgi:hypothetical protein